MGKQKQAKRNEKGKLPRSAVIAIIAVVAVLLLGSGVGFTHMSLASRYKDYNNTEPGWCSVCHKEPATHANANEWMVNHGLATALDRAGCMTCHKSDYCKDCHLKTPASHNNNWAAVHISSARRDEEGCYECHTSDYCTDCHNGLNR